MRVINSGLIADFLERNEEATPRYVPLSAGSGTRRRSRRRRRSARTSSEDDAIGIGNESTLLDVHSPDVN